jgi:Uma2 family endonuclease
MYAAMDAYPQYEVLPGLDTLLDRGRDYLCPDIVVTRSDATYDKDNDMLHARDALLAVEILSPGQTVDELFGKCKLLAAAGCPVCWVIHGEKRRAYLCDSFHDYSQVSRLEAHTLPADFWIPVDLLWP